MRQRRGGNARATRLLGSARFRLPTRRRRQAGCTFRRVDRFGRGRTVERDDLGRRAGLRNRRRRWSGGWRRHRHGSHRWLHRWRHRCLHRRLRPAGDQEVLARGDLKGRRQMVGGDDRPLGHMIGMGDDADRLAMLDDDALAAGSRKRAGTRFDRGFRTKRRRSALKFDRRRVWRPPCAGRDEARQCNRGRGTDDPVPTKFVFPHLPLFAHPRGQKTTLSQFTVIPAKAGILGPCIVVCPGFPLSRE